VRITDHPHTARQLVGDAVTCTREKKSLLLHRPLWNQDPRSIPGVPPVVYFWDLPGNKLSRPTAGLSACNETEATAVTNLTKWLLLCGVPPSSISIITPYKGQKSTLIKMLRNAKCIPGYSDKPPPPGTTITVSTVDRYQGDENDIIIFSNVRTAAGNKFVTMINRFIVTTSRARLGFYLIGSVNAVTDKQEGQRASSKCHWGKFIESLRDPRSSEDAEAGAGNGSDSAEGEGDGQGVLRRTGVGSKFPICCPRHRSKVKQVTSTDGFPTLQTWNKLCQEQCTNFMPKCGHRCSLLCHSPTATPHTRQDACEELLVRPCPIHREVPLQCKEIEFEKTDSLATATANSKCKIDEQHHRQECGHVDLYQCHDLELMRSGRKPFPACVVIVNDFIQPGCGHKIKAPKCTDCRKYEQSPPRCLEVVTHTRPCGCQAKMKCAASIGERRNPTLCTSQVKTKRPRCGHPVTMRCHLNTALQGAWDDVAGDAVGPDGIVTSGEEYGPSDAVLLEHMPLCEVSTTYRAQCGHVFSEIPCNDAFEMAAGRLQEPKCVCTVPFESPLCGHRVQFPCWAIAHLRVFSPWGENNARPEILYQHYFRHHGVKELSRELKAILKACCTGSTFVTRGCEHVFPVKCSSLYSYVVSLAPFPSCQTDVRRTLDCGHHIKVSCNKVQDPPPRCEARIHEKFTYHCSEHFIDVFTCNSLTKMRQDNPPCPANVIAKRHLCRHDVPVACHLKHGIEAAQLGNRLEFPTHGEHIVRSNTLYCSPSAALPPCMHSVAYCYPCEHYRPGVPCSEALSWASGEPALPCEQPLDLTSPLCGHSIQLFCGEFDAFSKWRPWGDDVDEGTRNDQPFLPPFETVSHIDEKGCSSFLCIAENELKPQPCPNPAWNMTCDGSAVLVRGEWNGVLVRCCPASLTDSLSV
jgi:AAA domain